MIFLNRPKILLRDMVTHDSRFPGTTIFPGALHAASPSAGSCPKLVNIDILNAPGSNDLPSPTQFIYALQQILSLFTPNFYRLAPYTHHLRFLICLQDQVRMVRRVLQCNSQAKISKEIVLTE